MVPAMIDTKLMTRETYTLYGIEGDFGNKDGKLTFTEKVSFFFSHPLARTVVVAVTSGVSLLSRLHVFLLVCPHLLADSCAVIF